MQPESAADIAAANRKRANERNILRKTAFDMVRSLAAIGVVVLVIFLLVPRPDTPVIPSANINDAAAAAESSGDVPVVIPKLPSAWKVTSARREAPDPTKQAAWHVGYLTPSGEYAGLEMTGNATAIWLSEATTSGNDVQTPQAIGGIAWATYVDSDGRVSLVKGAVGGPVTVVTGTATRDDLATLAEAVQQAGG